MSRARSHGLALGVVALGLGACGDPADTASAGDDTAADTASAGDDTGTDSDPDSGEVVDTTPRVLINELMADNAAAWADEAGEYDDWIELVNVGEVTVDLAGWTLGDAPDDPATTPFALSGPVLAPGERVVVWADGDTDQGALHVDFKLSKDGESVALWRPDATLADRVDFPALGTDTVYARVPDLGTTWAELDTPTPGAANPGP